MRPVTVLCTVALAASLAGCKFVPTAEVKALTLNGGDGSKGAFDPDKMVAGLWTAKMLPYLDAKAGSLADVLTLARQNPEAAGRRYGYRPKSEGAAFTIVTRFEGTIVTADTQSRAATLGVDVDGDGKPDAIVQIGPAIRGTALRDALDFVAFNDFTNQIDYARFGKSFNTYAERDVLAALPRDALIGRKASVLGAFPLGDLEQPVLVTPATITIGPKP